MEQELLGPGSPLQDSKPKYIARTKDGHLLMLNERGLYEFVDLIKPDLQTAIDKRNTVDRYSNKQKRYNYSEQDIKDIFEEMSAEYMIVRSHGSHQYDAAQLLPGLNFQQKDGTVEPNFEYVTEYDFPALMERSKHYYAYLSWTNRSDGHGGVKGGTMAEYEATKITDHSEIVLANGPV